MDSRGSSTRPEVLEIRAGQREGGVRVDVARERQRDVAGVIVGTEELPRVVESRCVEVGHLADRRPVVRMVGRKQRRQHHHRRETVRTVFVVLAALVEHDVALVREFCLGQRR